MRYSIWKRIFVVLLIICTLLTQGNMSVFAATDDESDYLIQYVIPSAIKTFTKSTGGWIELENADTNATEYYIRVDKGETLTLEATPESGYIISEVYVDGEAVDQSIWNTNGNYKYMTYTFDDGDGVTQEHSFELKCLSTSSTAACPDHYYVEYYHMNLDGETYTLYETVEYTYDGGYNGKAYGEILEYEGFTAPYDREYIVMQYGTDTTIKYYYERNKYYFSSDPYGTPEYVDITGTSECGEYYHGQTIYLNASICDEYIGKYVVDGWHGWEDEEIHYDAVDSFVMPMEDVLLTPETSEKTYTIQFDANGGIGTIANSKEISYYEEYTLPSEGFTKDGYVIIGWGLTPEQTAISYMLGEDVSELTTRDSITLYAIWGDLGETTFTVEHYVMATNGEYVLAETEYIESYTSEVFTAEDLIKEEYNNGKTTAFHSMTEDGYEINLFFPKRDNQSVIQMYYIRGQREMSLWVDVEGYDSWELMLAVARVECPIVLDRKAIERDVVSILDSTADVDGDFVLEDVITDPDNIQVMVTDETICFTMPVDSNIKITLKGSICKEETSVIPDGLNKADDGCWYYYKNNKVDTTYTGMAKNVYGWWYVKKGKLDKTYTGMAKNDYGWWYMKNGKLDTTYTGIATNEYGKWYMKNGKLDKSVSGFTSASGSWWMLKNGKVNTSYTGMAKNSYGWWYVKEGQLDKTYTGMAKNEYGWWYMKKGKLDTTYTGMAKNDYGWWYMTKGKLDQTYTGMAKNEYGWWYMKNGKLDTSYTGIAENEYGWWYMKNGKLDTSYTGTYQSGGKTYTIKNGKVVG